MNIEHVNMPNNDITSLGGFVWSIADILRGDFKQSEYGKVILPFVVLRRLDCILEGSKDAVLDAAKGLPSGVDGAIRMFQHEAEMRDIILTDPEICKKVTGYLFGRALREVRESAR
ncbi:type I restriction-modification system subunit M N-terminal domain-containing protein [Rhodovulum sp. YEN HP10]|uniref:type I restriction-modification system subunit M N-terminal domain-containing protein n=1 Tax=Rhodovulum sp. HP10 TaxID=3387397 RepID=UPI0039DFD61E